MSSPLKRKVRRARGFTLAELVVAMGIMLIISGLILGILIETRRSTRRAQAKLTMQIKAERTLESITSFLQAAVAPSALDTSKGPQPTFAAGHCSLIHSKRFSTSVATRGGLEWVFIRNRNFSTAPEEPGQDKNTRTTIAIHHASYQINPSPIQQEFPSDSKTSPSTSPSPYSISVSFKYATEIKTPGAETNFQDALAVGEYPRVIQVRVTVQDNANNLDPYELVTAVKML